MEDQEKSYLLPLDKELHMKVKLTSTKRNMSMKDFILLAIENEIRREEEEENVLPRESQVISKETW